MIKLQKNPRHIISSKYRICCLKSAKLLLIVTDFVKVLVSSNRSLVELYHWKHIHSIPHSLQHAQKLKNLCHHLLPQNHVIYEHRKFSFTNL